LDYAHFGVVSSTNGSHYLLAIITISQLLAIIMSPLAIQNHLQSSPSSTIIQIIYDHPRSPTIIPIIQIIQIIQIIHINTAVGQLLAIVAFTWP
jgi:hypothetical protein